MRQNPVDGPTVALRQDRPFLKEASNTPARNIRLRDVTFAYPGGAPVLEHFDLTIPAGSSLALVTWAERKDPNWFGARIPAAPKSMELVTVNLDAQRHPWFSYQDFEGSPLKNVSVQEGATPNERAAYILSQRAAVMP